MTVGPNGRGVDPVWVFLCVAVGAGLALWSLYVIGLFVLLVAVLSLGRAPESPRGRALAHLAMLAGFEWTMGILAALYWFDWDRRDGGFYVYLLVIAAMGALIVLLALRINRKKAVPWRW